MTITEQSQKCVKEMVRFLRTSGMNDADWRDFCAYVSVKTRLHETHGNRSQAAKLMGVHRNTVMRTLEELRGKGFPLPPKLKPAGRPRSIVDHRGIEIRRQQKEWEESREQ